MCLFFVTSHGPSRTRVSSSPIPSFSGRRSKMGDGGSTAFLLPMVHLGEWSCSPLFPRTHGLACCVFLAFILDSYVRRHSDGYETWLGRGEGLPSHGWSARVVVKGIDVCVMDDGGLSSCPEDGNMRSTIQFTHDLRSDRARMNEWWNRREGLD